jgi:hypothetical protein
LPHALDLYPQVIDPSLDAEDDVPRCSLADALEKQALFINTAVAIFASQPCLPNLPAPVRVFDRGFLLEQGRTITDGRQLEVSAGFDELQLACAKHVSEQFTDLIFFHISMWLVFCIS